MVVVILIFLHVSSLACTVLVFAPHLIMVDQISALSASCVMFPLERVSDLDRFEVLD
jgi:hypothetical protein